MQSRIMRFFFFSINDIKSHDIESAGRQDHLGHFQVYLTLPMFRGWKINMQILITVFVLFWSVPNMPQDGTKAMAKRKTVNGVQEVQYVEVIYMF